MTEQEQIAAADRITRFLGDSAVKGAFERLAERYVQEWKKGQTAEERESAWGRARALDDLAIELRAVVDAGTRAAVERQRREPKSNPTRIR